MGARTRGGNASHYYSLTRMPARGTVTIDGERFDVEGSGWMDHEFGSSFLDPGQVGWDWFSIQLDDGTDVMLYGMRRDDGSRDPHSSGTLVDAWGRPTRLGSRDFTLSPGETWRSVASGASYPVAWRVEVPGQRLVLDVRTPLPAQELCTERSTRVTYWEGAIEVTGTRAGRPVSAAEATEYARFALRIRRMRGAPIGPIWQRNYYEHLIRSEAEWQRIRDYIQANPSRWEIDDDWVIA